MKIFEMGAVNFVIPSSALIATNTIKNLKIVRKMKFIALIRYMIFCKRTNFIEPIERVMLSFGNAGKGKTMGRLIDSDVLKDQIEEWLDCVGDVVIGKSLSYYAELQGCIDDCPTVDAEPVRHGKWIFGETNGHSWMKCNQCLTSQDGQTACFTYCPSCGCRMDAE